MDKYFFNVNNKNSRITTADMGLVFLLITFSKYLPTG